AMVLEITVAEARATGAAPPTGPMVDAVMQAVQVAATVAAPAVDLTAQHVVSAVVVGMAADAANQPNGKRKGASPRLRSWALSRAAPSVSQVRAALPW
ncbi:MAG: hypothetical protein P4M04_14135, partial [Acidobacteriota bacterium]|nr:hypothetical protein [Acidobacteriota bacterium]